MVGLFCSFHFKLKRFFFCLWIFIFAILERTHIPQKCFAFKYDYIIINIHLFIRYCIFLFVLHISIKFHSIVSWRRALFTITKWTWSMRNSYYVYIDFIFRYLYIILFALCLWFIFIRWWWWLVVVDVKKINLYFLFVCLVNCQCLLFFPSLVSLFFSWIAYEFSFQYTSSKCLLIIIFNNVPTIVK